MIGNFEVKYNHEAILFVKNMIEGKSGDSQIIMDRMSFTATVIITKLFSSFNYAEKNVREHTDNQNFPHRYDRFWCNINNTQKIKLKKYLDLF